MKKITSIILSIFIAFSFTACIGGEDPAETTEVTIDDEIESDQNGGGDEGDNGDDDTEELIMLIDFGVSLLYRFDIFDHLMPVDFFDFIIDEMEEYQTNFEYQYDESTMLSFFKLEKARLVLHGYLSYLVEQLFECDLITTDIEKDDIVNQVIHDSTLFRQVIVPTSIIPGASHFFNKSVSIEACAYLELIPYIDERDYRIRSVFDANDSYITVPKHEKDLLSFSGSSTTMSNSSQRNSKTYYDENGVEITVSIQLPPDSYTVPAGVKYAVEDYDRMIEFYKQLAEEGDSLREVIEMLDNDEVRDMVLAIQNSLDLGTFTASIGDDLNDKQKSVINNAVINFEARS